MATILRLCNQTIVNDLHTTIKVPRSARRTYAKYADYWLKWWSQDRDSHAVRLLMHTEEDIQTLL